jgi:hypothetical protein
MLPVVEVEVTVCVSGAEVRLDPHLQGSVRPLDVADDDRAELLSIATAEEVRIERNRLRELRQIVRIEREDPQSLAHPGSDFRQTLRVRLGKARDAHVLEVNPMFLGQR